MSDLAETNLLQYNPDLIEIRLDLLRGDLPEIVQEWYAKTEIPLILTLRSEQEGGSFSGDSDNWIETITPLLPYASYIDIEQRFSSHARFIREQGVSIIASYHMKRMPSIQELAAIDDALREYGDIPKIVVTPSDEHDMIIFLSFTLHAEKPVITSIMGEHSGICARFSPCLVRSGYSGMQVSATAAGQYHIRDLQEIYARLLQETGRIITSNNLQNKTPRMAHGVHQNPDISRGFLFHPQEKERESGVGYSSGGPETLNTSVCSRSLSTKHQRDHCLRNRDNPWGYAGIVPPLNRDRCRHAGNRHCLLFP